LGRTEMSKRGLGKQVARTAGFAVRVFSVAIIATVPYSIAVSKLRRPFLCDRCFSVAVQGPGGDSIRSPKGAHQQKPRATPRVSESPPIFFASPVGAAHPPSIPHIPLVVGDPVGFQQLSESLGARRVGIASSADRRFCGPRLFALVTERSNSCARIGGHSHAVDDQTVRRLTDSLALVPTYSLQLDHRQSSARLPKPARTGLW